MTSMPRCELCPRTSRCIPGDGPLPLTGPTHTRVMFIGSAPGTEGDEPRMFMGKSGREFNENYLRLAGLDRDDIYITNIVKCRTESGNPPSSAITACCGGYHLPDEIESAAPEFIVLMGALACSLVPEINLDVEHGLPMTGKIFDWSGTIIPMYHPSAGMRDTASMIPLLEDFTRLQDVLTGKWVSPFDTEIVMEYQYVRTGRDISHSFLFNLEDGNWPATAVDMETHAGKPFSIQWSTAPGKSYMLLLEPAIAAEVAVKMRYAPANGHAPAIWGGPIYQLDMELNNYTHNVIFHNAGGDLDVLNSLGIQTPACIRDTMQEAYHLGNLPQGLKALSYRLLGIRMKSWMEVVGPPSRNAALDWIVAAIEHAKSNFQTREETQLKTKLKVTFKPSKFETRLHAILRYGCFNDDYPIWKHMVELQETYPDQFADVTSTLGELPQLGIANCTPADALEYACKDADVTRRVAYKLEELRAAQSLRVPESDWDKLSSLPD